MIRDELSPLVVSLLSKWCEHGPEWARQVTASKGKQRSGGVLESQTGRGAGEGKMALRCRGTTQGLIQTQVRECT